MIYIYGYYRAKKKIIIKHLIPILLKTNKSVNPKLVHSSVYVGYHNIYVVHTSHCSEGDRYSETIKIDQNKYF
jgi:hypothetical protein